MKSIAKGPVPPELIAHQKSTNPTYENFRHRDRLRNALVAEQRGLCCYCQSRIRATADHMKIEHWHSQSRYAGEALDYQNLLGACRGNEGQPKSLQHCDTSKGDSVLSRNPANPADNVETHVVYLGDGRISSRDTQFQNELEAVLNLNTPRLVNNRKATLDAFTQAIPLTG